MRTKTRVVGVLAASASAVALMGAPAFASTGHAHAWRSHHATWVTSGNGSILGGNQIYAPISVPINVCGNAVAVLGIAGAGCRGGAGVF